MYITEFDRSEDGQVAGTEKTCPMCGKVFTLPVGSRDIWFYQYMEPTGRSKTRQHTYKRRHLCSYTCLRTYEKRNRKGLA